MPFSAGQVFGIGELPADKYLDGLQLDVKATHADGSVRHAVVSGIVPMIGPWGTQTIPLLVTDEPPPNRKRLRILNQVIVRVKLDGVTYTARNSAAEKTPWLDGNVVTERRAISTLLSEDGVSHPHLMARFDMRSYDDRTRMDLIIENNWAYEPNPQNFTYDVEIEVSGKKVYEKKGLTHLHHARWRKMFWDGDEPQIHIKHDTAYLIASRALPNYDQSTRYSEKRLEAIGKLFDPVMLEPMAVGLTRRDMGATGGRADIGILPGWDVDTLLTQDIRARRLTDATANGSGSWSIHYRNKDTDRPVTLIDFPYMTIKGNTGDTRNPVTKKYEAFPALVKGQSDTPNSYDSSHHPRLNYLSYLLTGDRYHLEEIQFTAMYNVFASNPGYRGNIQGLVYRTQTRGQAWILCTLAQAAFIVPDDDPMKAHLIQLLRNNIAWYTEQYATNPAANLLGVLDDGNSVIYLNKIAVAPWQDDFLTAAFGLMVELGFDEARPMLEWKAKFVIGRMSELPQWVGAAPYNLVVVPKAGAPIFKTIREVYTATFGEQFMTLKTEAEVEKLLKLKPGEMEGRGGYELGYPANMQPALAYSGDQKAWRRFYDRLVKPDYSNGPQFSIVPR